jgi:hypothetical protein
MPALSLRKLAFSMLIIATAGGWALTGFAPVVASKEKPMKTTCATKEQKMQILRDASAPVLR